MRPERWLGRLRYRLGGDQVVEDVRQGVSVFVQAFNVAASSYPSPLLGTPSTSKRRFNPPRNDSRVHRASRSSRGTLRTSCRLVSFLSFVSFPFPSTLFPLRRFSTARTHPIPPSPRYVRCHALLRSKVLSLPPHFRRSSDPPLWRRNSAVSGPAGSCGTRGRCGRR